MPTRSFHSKIAGVSHRNPDARERQEIIEHKCRVGDKLELTPEPNNSVDPNAIAVYRERRWFGRGGEQLGYLPAEILDILQRQGEAEPDLVIEAEITDLTGGTPEKPTRGVNILITLRDTD